MIHRLHYLSVKHQLIRRIFMKHSFLSYLLGASLLLVSTATTTSTVLADNNWKSNKHAQKHANKHHKKHVKKFKKPFSGLSHKHNNRTCQINHNTRNTRSNNKPRFVPRVKQQNNWNNMWNDFQESHNNAWESTSVTTNGFWGENTRNHGNNHAARINKRLDRQARRIRRGIQNGQLVRREIRVLRDEQYRIENRLAHFRSDGRLNRHERNKINRMLDVASNHIRTKRHNRVTQNNRYDRYPQNSSYEFVINW